MIDIHMHIIPGVDDGASDLQMAETMLRSAIEQGITSIIATSHNKAFYRNADYVRQNYGLLQTMIRDKALPIKVYLGCEVYCEAEEMEEILACLDTGKIPSMNDTRYVLAEFWRPTQEEFEYCISKLLQNNWIPIIAHVERYPALGLNCIRRMKTEGCLVQINAYSVLEEKDVCIKMKARELLENKLVDFMGSDAHRIGPRPPRVERAIEYLYKHYEADYVNDILENNAKTLLGLDN